MGSRDGKTWSDSEPLLREEPAVFAGSLEGQCGKERGAQNDSKDLDLSKGKDRAVVSQDGKDGKRCGAVRGARR